MVEDVWGKRPCSGGWFQFLGRSVWLLVLAVPSHAAGLEAATYDPAGNSPQFRITHLAYEPDGRLVSAPESIRESATSLFYGEWVPDVVFVGTEDSGNRTAPSSDDRLQPAGLPRPRRPRFSIDSWDRERGLPANKVNAILQSRDGYLWIGTVDGLARFDGLRFARFSGSNTPEMREHGTIARALFEDDAGRLWIGTERGMLCYAGGRFIEFPGQEELRGRHVRAIARRSAGGFWFGAGGRLGCWDGKEIRWEEEIDPGPDAANRILGIAEGPGNILWFGGFGGLWRFDLKTRDTVNVPLETAENARVRSVLVDRRGRLWIGAMQGVWWMEPGESSPRPLDPHSGRGTRGYPCNALFSEGPTGTVWASSTTGNGIVQIADGPSGPEMIRVADELEQTTYILVDREGVVWVGSRTQGLFRLRVRRFATFVFGGDSILDDVRSVSAAPDGRLWFASRSNIGCWSGNEIWLFDTRRIGARDNSPVLALPWGGAMTSSPSGGWLELPFAPGEASAVAPAVPLFPEIGEVNAICTRADGSVWLGAGEGLYRVKGRSQLEAIAGFESAGVLALCEDPEGNFWVGTADGGLSCLTADGWHRELLPGGPQEATIYSLHAEKSDSLWVGTAEGLRLFREGRFTRFTGESRLPQDPVHCILQDDYGRLWLRTPVGVYRVPADDLRAWSIDRARVPAVAEFGTADGIWNVESAGGAQPAGTKTPDGRLWFTSRRGIVTVDPAECMPEALPPKVLLEAVAVDGEWRPAPADGALRLPPGTGDHLDFQFAFPSLHSPERVRVEYRLEGHDRQWREAGPIRTASYVKLTPGHYRLRVRAWDHEGRAAQAEGVLALQLAPWFWQKPLFQALCGALAAGGSGGLAAWGLRRNRRRARLEKTAALDHERARIAREMHNHLGARLAGLALSADLKGAAHQTVRETLCELNELIWSVDPGNDSLSGLADHLAVQADRFLAAARIELELDFPEEIPARTVSHRFRHELTGMFKETLRNIVQHAGATRVTVRMQTGNERLVLAVRDNGCGFTPSQWLKADSRGPAPLDSAGNGLRLLRSGAVSLGGECRIDSAPGRGTVVEFAIPLNEPSR